MPTRVPLRIDELPREYERDTVQRVIESAFRRIEETPTVAPNGKSEQVSNATEILAWVL